MNDIYQLVQDCAQTVAPSTMMRIINVESTQVSYAIGYKITKDKRVYQLTKQPVNVSEAQAWATWFLANGYRFDAGIAQVNSSNFGKFGLTPANVFEACTNIKAGGAILTAFYKDAARKYGDGQKALYAAISAYQTGNFYTGFATGYVQKVVSKKVADPPIRQLAPPIEQVIQLDINDAAN